MLHKSVDPIGNVQCTCRNSYLIVQVQNSKSKEHWPNSYSKNFTMSHYQEHMENQLPLKYMQSRDSPLDKTV